jgi:hypothetical protein
LRGRPGSRSDAPRALLEEISTTGFEIALIQFENPPQFATLIAEVEEHGLWDPLQNAETSNKALVMANPFGFRRISTSAEFQTWLPVVDEVALA